MENKETQFLVQQQADIMEEDFNSMMSNNPYGPRKATPNTKKIFKREFEDYLWSKNCSSEEPTFADVKKVFEDPAEMGAFTIHLIKKIESLVFDKRLRAEQFDYGNFDEWLDKQHSTPLVIQEKNKYDYLEGIHLDNKES